LSKQNDLSEIPLNRGVGIMLGGGKKPPKPKSFQYNFSNMLRFFNRELHFNLELSLDIKKDIPEEVEK
tara:strand:- start:1002 stop:1205 length:204 start_codon:yes stop_codon:yes gene_type:complete